MLWIINAVLVVQLVLIIDLSKRQSHTQRTLSYLEHHQGKNFNYLVRLIEEQL